MKNKNLFTAILLIVLGVASRTIWHVWPNVELVTSIALISSSFLSRKWTLFVIISVMAISDMLIGNTNIFIFTWSGFLIPALIASGFFQKNNPKRFKRIGIGTLAGISSTAFFFLWTNFGVWILSSLYPKTLLGLLSSYINALPFLRLQAVSTLIFVPLGFLLTEFSLNLLKKYQARTRVQGSLV